MKPKPARPMLLTLPCRMLVSALKSGSFVSPSALGILELIKL
jgi:hypothetical protein